MTRHPATVHWREIEEPEPGVFRGTEETMSKAATFGDHFGLKTVTADRGRAKFLVARNLQIFCSKDLGGVSPPAPRPRFSPFLLAADSRAARCHRPQRSGCR